MKQRTKRMVLWVSVLMLGVIALGSVLYNVYLNSSIQTLTALKDDEYRAKVINGYDDKIVPASMYNMTLYSTPKAEYDASRITIEDIDKDEFTITTEGLISVNTVYDISDTNREKNFYWIEVTSVHFWSEAQLIDFGNDIVFSMTNKSADFAMSVLSTQGSTTVNGSTSREWNINVLALNDSEGTGYSKKEIGFSFAFIPSVNYQCFLICVEFNETADASWISEKPANYIAENMVVSGNYVYMGIRFSFHEGFETSLKFASGLGTDFGIEALKIGYILDTSAVVTDIAA